MRLGRRRHGNSRRTAPKSAAASPTPFARASRVPRARSPAGPARPPLPSRRARSPGPGSRARSSRTAVISSPDPRPRRVAREHSAELRHLVRARARPLRRRARARRCGSPAPSRRRTHASRASSATAISAFPGPSAPIRLTCWPGCSEPSASSTSWPGVIGHEQVGGERLLARAGDRAAELRRGRRPRALRRRPRATTSRPRARNVRAAARPFTPAPTTAAVSASGRPSVSAASTAAAPVRSAVTAAASSTRPSRRSTRPRAARRRVTVGSPRAGLPGNDVTHLSSAWPAAERGHRAEVARPGRRARRPSAASTTRRARRRRTRRAPPRARARARPRPRRRPAAKNRDPHDQSDLTSAISFMIDSFASPNSITVFGLRRAGCRSRRSRGSCSA